MMVVFSTSSVPTSLAFLLYVHIEDSSPGGLEDVLYLADGTIDFEVD